MKGLIVSGNELMRHDQHDSVKSLEETQEKM